MMTIHMDRSTTIGGSEPGGASPEPRIADGFPGERMRVLPRPLVARALAQPPTAAVLVTDAGFFPRAAHHWRSRAFADETIVIHCVSGRGLCRVGSRTFAVEPHQVLVIPAGIRHRYEADATDPWTIWWAHITGAAIAPLVATIARAGDSPVFDVAEPTRVTGLLDTILRRMETDEGSGSLVAAGGAAWHLLAVLAADRRVVARGRPDPISGVRDYLRENLAEHISVDQLAAMAGFSVSHFSALFRKATGFGALEYQTRLRMSMARQLLDTTDRTVTSIARQVGYGDPMYFSRQFRRIHHLSPTQYRTRERSEADDLALTDPDLADPLGK